MSEKKWSEKDLALLLLVLAMGIGAVAFWWTPSTDPSATAAGPDAEVEARKRKELEDRVNRHIQLTNRKIETDREKIEQEKRFTIPQVGQLAIQPNNELTGGVVTRGDRNEYNTIRDLERDRSAPPPSMNNQIQEELAENQARQRHNEAAMKEYARQFVENARRNGYDVKLSEDYRVLDVRKLPAQKGEPITDADGQAFR